MKVSAAIAEILRRENVDVMFGYPRNAVPEPAAEKLCVNVRGGIAATRAGRPALLGFITTTGTRASQL